MIYAIYLLVFESKLEQILILLLKHPLVVAAPLAAIVVKKVS